MVRQRTANSLASFVIGSGLALVFLTVSCQSAVSQEKTASAAEKGGSRDWPQWRGIHRDGKSQETGLLKSWPEGGPKLLWTFRNAGLGYSQPTVVGNVLYCLGTEGMKPTVSKFGRGKGKDADPPADSGEGYTIAFALDLSTGNQIWKTRIDRHDPDYLTDWGDGPRGAATIDGDRLYALSVNGTLVCLQTKTGEKIWSKNLETDFGGKTPQWGYSESPLIDGDRVLVTPGGAKFIVGLNKLTGQTVYETSGFEGEAQYVSIMKVEGNGGVYVTGNKQGVVGFAADDGRNLFLNETVKNNVAVIPTPLVDGPFVYSTSGYPTRGGGKANLLEIKADGSTIVANEVWANEEMSNHHGGVVLIDGFVYGHTERGGWICQDFKTGEVKWKDRSRIPGKGSVSYADGRLYCYSEKDNILCLVEPNPTGWKEVSRMSMPETSKINRKNGLFWTHPVIAQGKLIMRDLDLIFCFDVKE